MHNLIFHANARALDPVGGVYKITCDLKHKIECCQAELNMVHQQLAMYRSLAQQQQMQRQRQDLGFGCYSYGDLLEQEDEEQYANVVGYDHQNVQQHQEMMQQQSPLSYEMFLEMPEQTSKVKLEKEGISDPEQNNFLSQLLMSS